MVKIVIDEHPYELDEGLKNAMEYISEVEIIEGTTKEEVV
jgi:hypothetical protein